MALTESDLDRLTGETVELLQALIRNACVNDGSYESGHEDKSARTIENQLEGVGLDIEKYVTGPDRSSLVVRYPGTDPAAPSICLMGHTDVVPVSPDGWTEDPFGGELIGDEIWGRGAVDMLNLTSSMAVAFRHVVQTGTRYPGDIVYFAVADEEAGGAHGAKQLIETQWDHLRCDYLLTEFGGIPFGDSILVTTAEKGVAWRRLHVDGTPGHGSMPWGTDNAVVTAAEVVRRLHEYRPAPVLDEMWNERVRAMDLPAELTSMLLDPDRLEAAFDQLPPGVARNAHSCSHTTFSPNVVHGGVKTNVIPDRVSIDVDIRTLPGETDDDVTEHLRSALGDLFERVSVERLQHTESTASGTDNDLWNALTGAMAEPFPRKRAVPSLITGGTDSRFFRQKGVVAFGAGLLSDQVTVHEFQSRFHGHNERIDIESLRLTTKLWFDVLDRLWANP